MLSKVESAADSIRNSTVGFSALSTSLRSLVDLNENNVKILQESK
jgi:hypothetical protein